MRCAPSRGAAGVAGSPSGPRWFRRPRPPLRPARATTAGRRQRSGARGTVLRDLRSRRDRRTSPGAARSSRRRNRSRRAPGPRRPGARRRPRRRRPRRARRGGPGRWRRGRGEAARRHASPARFGSWVSGSGAWRRCYIDSFRANPGFVSDSSLTTAIPVPVRKRSVRGIRVPVVTEAGSLRELIVPPDVTDAAGECSLPGSRHRRA